MKITYRYKYNFYAFALQLIILKADQFMPCNVKLKQKLLYIYDN